MSQEQKDSDFRPDTDSGGQGQTTPDSHAAMDQPEPMNRAETATPEDIPLVDHDKLTELQSALEKALTKAEENWNLYLSARADIDNIRKRGERDLQNAHKFALKDFIDTLLPVKDSLEMGIAAANETSDVDKLREGSELTLKLLMGAMEKFGVQEVDPLGDKFNPELHEAMAMQPSTTAEPNTVLQVIQKGYTLNERLIRPAMVIVAQGGQASNSQASDSQTSSSS